MFQTALSPNIYLSLSGRACRWNRSSLAGSVCPHAGLARCKLDHLIQMILSDVLAGTVPPCFFESCVLKHDLKGCRHGAKVDLQYLCC